jgi:glutaredoxin
MASLARAACRLVSASKNQFLISSHVRFCQSSSQLPILTLFTKEDCQLCEEALEELSPFLHQVKLKEVDIEDDDSEEEYNKFRYEIPVFFLNNKFLCKNRIDLDKFHSALETIKKSSEK